MLRSEQVPEERPGLEQGPTLYRTFVNRFAARCWTCGVQNFVDESVHAAIVTAAEAGLDYPFVCADCEDKYDELAHGRG